MSEPTKTLVIGDVHGNVYALLDILGRAGAIDENHDRLPGFRIISVGDVVNCAPDKTRYRGFFPTDYETLSLVYEGGLIDEICVGNHELFYTHDRESGRFGGMAYSTDMLHPKLEPLMKEMVKEGIYKAATTAHGWLITHAGVAPQFQTGLGKDTTVEDVAAQLNFFLEYNKPSHLIDNAGYSVGGTGVGGIVWFRPDDIFIADQYFGKPLDGRTDLKQIVGHTIDADNPQYLEPLNMWFIDSGSYMDGKGSGIIWNGESWEPVVQDEVVEKV
jgi:hypothetical protein